MKFSDFSGNLTRSSSSESVDPLFSFSVLSPEMRDAIESVKYIAENMKMQNEAKEVRIYFTITQTAFMINLLCRKKSNKKTTQTIVRYK